jgi:pimeloyl-ACP methyl ester carboxylesterase
MRRLGERMLNAQVKGEGRPLLVLPGFGLDAAYMAHVFEPVFAAPEQPAARTSWQRIYLDLPGAGGSAPVEPSSDAVLEAVGHTVKERFGDTPFALAGHSYGGYLAIALARRLPQQVRGLLLSASGVRIQPDQRDLDGVLPSAPEPGWLDAVPETLHEHLAHGVGQQTRAVGDRLAEAFAQLAPMDEPYLEKLRSTGYPLSEADDGMTPFGGRVSILAGRRDRIAGYRDQFGLLTRYPQGSYTLLSEAGHYLPLEQPEVFATLTLEWLARVESADGS